MNPKLNFTKLSGLGNDFILFDNREKMFSGEERDFFRKICQRRTSVGADGVILLENSDRADFKYRHFNADGSVAEMCGNGARSICYYAVTHGIAPKSLSFEIHGAIYRATVDGHQVRLTMPPPEKIWPKPGVISEDLLEEGGFVQIGVPHLVVFTSNLDALDVARLGRYYRHHPFFPAGTNVNFVQVLDSQTIRIRTYERGVEGETLACGTGSTAAAIISHLAKGLQPPITVQNPGGDLWFSWENAAFDPIFMQGAVEIIYQAELFQTREAGAAVPNFC
jgi:diaminopimelate epimerase